MAIELLMFSLNALTLIHSYRSTGLIQTMQTYLPVGITATIVDNIVVAAGYLQYDGPYLLWLGNVPLAAALTWGSILHIMRALRKILRNQFGRRIPWNALLATAGTILDAAVERLAPSAWLGWTWIINNPVLRFPARNSAGWFLILASSLLIQEWMRTRAQNEAAKLLATCGLSILQTLIILLTLISLGYLID